MTDRPERRRRSRLRFETLNAFVDRGISEAELTPAGVSVWLVLFRHGDPDGTTEASVDCIAAQANLNRRTVLRALAELRGKQMLRTIKKGGIGRGASRYLLAPYPMVATK